MANRILHVENDPDQAEYTRGLLPADEFSVSRAGDLSTALVHLREEAVDLLLLDLHLPDGEGIAAFLKMSSQRLKIPVVVTLDLADNVMEERCLEMGAQDCLVKSAMNAESLQGVLRRAIHRHSFIQSLVQSLKRPESGRSVSAESKSILIIEDDPDQSALYRSLLTRLGYETRAVDSGNAAIQILADWEPQIILVDLNLPGMDGIETIETIRTNERLLGVPVIMMSSTTDETTIMRALSSGADEFVGKPLRMGELTLRIGNLLSLKEKERRLSLLNDKLEKEKTVLSRYFTEDFVDQVLTEKISPNLGGDNIPATLLFFDLRDSTGTAERMSPEQFSGFLSGLLTDLMDLIQGSGGSVNKFTGDGLLATFGCPLPSGGNDDALNAVGCALKIRDYMKMYNEFPPFNISKPVDYGVGIATGPVFAGNVGSVRRMEYTVLGDAVNLASRLETLTKKARMDILIDHATQTLIADHFRFKSLKAVAIRGKKEPVQIYHVLDEMKSADADLAATV